MVGIYSIISVVFRSWVFIEVVNNAFHAFCCVRILNEDTIRDCVRRICCTLCRIIYKTGARHYMGIVRS